MDPWIIIVGIAQLLAVLTGFLMGRITRPPRTPSYACTCLHEFSFHNTDGCHEYYQDHKGKRHSCGCQRYVGQLPPPTVDEIMRDVPGSL